VGFPSLIGPRPISLGEILPLVRLYAVEEYQQGLTRVACNTGAGQVSLGV
jgi:hypothetical protein